MNVWGERECVDKKQIMLGSQGVICLFLVQGELWELESKKAHPGQAAEGFPGRLNSLEFILQTVEDILFKRFLEERRITTCASTA